ncbi:MAG: hypothetical protein ACI9DJ_000960 [Algoriphagus sp.]|jgi:hypothetical protein
MSSLVSFILILVLMPVWFMIAVNISGVAKLVKSTILGYDSVILAGAAVDADVLAEETFEGIHAKA